MEIIPIQILERKKVLIPFNSKITLGGYSMKFPSAIQYLQTIHARIRMNPNLQMTLEEEQKAISLFSSYSSSVYGRNPADYDYDIHVMSMDGVDSQFVKDIWKIDISKWNAELLNHWICRVPPDESKDPHLVSITHYKRYGPFRCYLFCCIFSATNASSGPFSEPIWIYYSALKRSTVYDEHILCGRKYQWNWNIMQFVDDCDYAEEKNKTADQLFDDMENPTLEQYKTHSMDEALKVMKDFVSTSTNASSSANNK